MVRPRNRLVARNGENDYVRLGAGRLDRCRADSHQENCDSPQPAGFQAGSMTAANRRSSMRPFFRLCLAFIGAMIAASALAQQRETRLALVIGNANYPDASTPLSSTI